VPLTPDAKILPQPEHSAKEVEMFLPYDRERLQEPCEASSPVEDAFHNVGAEKREPQDAADIGG
jgi:hypothetical protein